MPCRTAPATSTTRPGTPATTTIIDKALRVVIASSLPGAGFFQSGPAIEPRQKPASSQMPDRGRSGGFAEKISKRLSVGSSIAAIDQPSSSRACPSGIE